MAPVMMDGGDAPPMPPAPVVDPSAFVPSQRRVVHASDDFLPCFQIADAGIGITVEFDRERRLQLLRAFELFVRFRGRESVFHGKPGCAQILDEL